MIGTANTGFQKFFRLLSPLFLLLGQLYGENYPESVEKNLSLTRYYLYINEDSSLLYNNLVYNYAVKNRRIALESEVLLLKAEILLYKGNLENVFEICRTVRETAQNTGNRKLLVRSMLLQGRYFTEMNIFDKAYAELYSAKEIAEQIHDSTLLSNILNALGVIYDIQKEPEQSLDYYEQALKYAKEQNDPLLQIRLLNNKAIVYTEQGRLQEAKELLFFCISHIRERRIAFGLDRLYMNLAPIYISEDKTDSALLNIDRSLQIATQSNNQSSIARSLIYKGYILFTQNKITESKQVFERADSIALTMGADNMHCMILQYFVWIAEAEQDYKSAYLYLQQYKNASDSLSIKRNVVNMIRLKMENESVQAQLESQHKLYRLIMTTVFLVLILILGCIAFFYWYKHSRKLLKNKQRENSVLASELEQENKKMVTQSLLKQKRTNDLQEIARQLKEHRNFFKLSNQPIIDRTISLLVGSNEEEQWQEFETRFERVHTGFMKNLQKRYPNLSTTEKRLCAYLRLNMTTKEIANILHVSSRAVEQSRYRLRKKLGVGRNQDLGNFLCSFD